MLDHRVLTDDCVSGAIDGVAGSVVLDALERLDELLGRALEIREEQTQGRTDPYRGLVIRAGEVSALIQSPTGQPLFRPPLPDRPPNRLDRLGELFGISAREVDLIIVALAPEIDLKYERIFAYLQDDVQRRRPTVDLLLDLVCHDRLDKLAGRRWFSAEAPLIEHQLVTLQAEDGRLSSGPLLACEVAVDGLLVDWLTGHRGLDRRLLPYAEVAETPAGWSGLSAEVEGGWSVIEYLGRQRDSGAPFAVHLHGLPTPCQDVARHAAGELKLPLLTLHLDQLMATGAAAGPAIGLAIRYGRLHETLVHLAGVDEASAPALTPALDGMAGWCLTSGTQSWPSVGDGRLPSLTVRPASTAGRAAAWAEVVDDSNEAIDLGVLTTSFRLEPNEIVEVATSATTTARLLGRDEASQQDLVRSARSRRSRGLDGLARRIEPSRTWSDLVLDVDVQQRLGELRDRVIHRSTVLDDMGFGRRLGSGGITALFAGPSGTGKTMAAEVIAGELGLELFKIDLASVVSKYIGETEKNLRRVFDAAAGTDGVLMFDEADALFGRRSEVKDSHDRYANLETSYLLQKMEEFEGFSILTTNLRHHLDDAFTRRLSSIVHFPVPDVVCRRRLWAAIWPSAVELADDVDFDHLASAHRLTGGHVANVAMAAAARAAADRGVVTKAMIEASLAEELRKLGIGVAA